MKVWLIGILLFLFAIIGTPILAQDEMATVRIPADDGLELVGDFYPAAEGEIAPAVLLLHMLGSNRHAYEPLLPFLREAGYNILNVDMRGHGDTGSLNEWVRAESDTQLWLDWLRQQETVDAQSVGIIGASIGSNMALIACGNDTVCTTAIALSPGLEYQGVEPLNAVVNNLEERPVLLIASHNDRYSAESVEQMFSDAPGLITARLYPGNAHGTRLFDSRLEDVSTLILNWLDEYLAHGEEDS